jgi:predicted nucleic acid-binding protein
MSRIFLDSNVLVAILMQSDPNHQIVSEWIKEKTINNEFIVSPQVIAETYATITSPTKFTKPLSPGIARSGLLQFIAAMEVKLVPIGEKALVNSLKAAQETGKRARQFFDLLIWGTMIEHRIKILATFNQRDFKSLTGIKLIVPGKLKDAS